MAAPVLRSVGRLVGTGLPLCRVEHRLGIESIDVRRPAVHEQVDNPLGPRPKRGSLGDQRIVLAIDRGDARN